jgi:hypothetical protein
VTADEWLTVLRRFERRARDLATLDARSQHLHMLERAPKQPEIAPCDRRSTRSPLSQVLAEMQKTI